MNFGDEWYLASYGARALFRSGRDVYLRDVSLGTSRLVFTAQKGNQVGSWALGDQYAVLVEGDFARHPNRVPCADAGSLTWRMWLIDTTFLVPTPREIHSGVQQRDIFCGAAWPVVSLDRDRIGWAIEMADPDELAWQLTVESVDGAVESSYEVARQVAAVDLTDDGLAFIRGDAEAYGFFSNTYLSVVPQGETEPIELGDRAFSVALADARVIWTEYLPGSDCLCPQIFVAASLPDLVPREVGRTAETDGFFSAAGDFVADGNLEIHLHRLSTLTEYLVTPTSQVTWLSVRGGWLTWTELAPDATEIFYGVPLEDLPFN